MKNPQVPPRLRRSAGRVVRRLKRRLVRRQPPAPTPAPRKRAKPPQLSVVLVVHNAELYLNQCVQSLLGQSLKRLEIIAVDDGSTDGSSEILDRLAATHRRVRVIHTDHQGAGPARRLGVRRARGTYLTFVGAQDTVPRDAYGRMVRSLQTTGSDVVVGAVARVKNGRSSQPVWSTVVHKFDRLATSIDECPEAMTDLLTYNRVYRRAFWTQAVDADPETGEYGDVLATMGAYLRASRFDVLRAVTYRWHLRTDHASLVQERYDHTMLSERLPVLEAAWQLVSTQATAAVAGAWLGGVLDFELSAYLEQANTADDAYRETLQQTARYFYDQTTALAWQHVRVDRKLRVWLAVQGRWSVLEQCVEYFRLNGSVPPTRLLDGRVLADLPFRDALGDEMPQVCLELSANQTSLASCIQKAFWNAEGQLVLQGWSYIRGVDLSTTTPVLAACLVEPETEERFELPLEPLTIPAASRWGNARNQNVDAAGFRITVDVSMLPPANPTGGPRRWSLQLSNRTHGIERSGPVRSVIRSGVAMRARARDLKSADERFRYVPLVDFDNGFALQVRPDRVRAVRLSAGADGRISGTLRIINPVAVPIVAVRATSGGAQVDVPVIRSSDGSLHFNLTLPAGERIGRRWSFRALGEDGRRYRVSWPDEVSTGKRVAASDFSVAWLRSARGFTDLVTQVVGWQADALTLRDDLFQLEVETAGLRQVDLWRSRLRSGTAQVPVSQVADLGQGRYRLNFAVRTEIWGTPDLPLPPGTYTLELDTVGPSGNTVVVTCGITESLLEQCPIFGLTSIHGLTAARVAGRDRLTVALRAPLADNERGRFAQRRLASWYDETEFEPRDAVLFQCYRGEFSTDTQRALHEELYRRRSPLALLWAVASLSVPLPDGAVPLLIGSRAWYEAVGSARYLCQNIDYDRFFRKRPHQKYLQTFHGYPWKSMGVSLWRAQGKSESLIALECERRNSAWDSILVPAPFCEELYRREYRYPHEVLVTGYPRDDALVTSDAAAVRSAVLARLGIPAHHTVVLYAPTWRDTVATGAWTAAMFNELDLDRLRDELGDDYTVLLRGHNYNLRAGSMRASASVLNVSSYPEVNDLILAADVAILDYSSMRFDWMLTNKPVLFFVPDLANYLSARTVLFEYAPTAPGPLLTTTEQVVSALHDLANLTEEYAPDREAFNREYQTLHDGHATQRVVNSFFGADAGRTVDASAAVG